MAVPPAHLLVPQNRQVQGQVALQVFPNRQLATPSHQQAIPNRQVAFRVLSPQAVVLSRQVPLLYRASLLHQAALQV